MELNQIMTNADLQKIVRVTNKTDFDFTPEMGARYGGVPYLLPSGKSMFAPKPIATHLAKHLARQVFIKQAPIRSGSETDGKGTDRALWTEEDIKAMQARFLSDEFEEATPQPKTEAEIMAARIAVMNENFADMAPKPATTPAPAGPEVTTTSAPKVYKDKAEVIAELTARNVKFDVRASKAKLEELLK